MTNLPRVMLVDDNEEFGALLSHVFQNFGARFVADFAATGAGALSLLDTFSFSAVVLDMKLPDKTGAQVAEEIRATHPQMPIALFTNYDIGATHDAVNELGLFYWPKEHLLADLPAFVHCVECLTRGHNCWDATQRKFRDADERRRESANLSQFRRRFGDAARSLPFTAELRRYAKVL